jgi:hypothetical protein
MQSHRREEAAPPARLGATEQRMMALIRNESASVFNVLEFSTISFRLHSATTSCPAK